ADPISIQTVHQLTRLLCERPDTSTSPPVSTISPPWFACGTLDDAHEGFISKVLLTECSVQFWKSEDDGPVVRVPITGSFSDSESQQSEYTSPQTPAVGVEELPRGRIDFDSKSLTSDEIWTFMLNVLPGLRLNYLVSLEVILYGLNMHMNVWTMLGDLPSVAHLTLHHYADNPFKVMELACPGMRDDTAEQSDAVPVASADTNPYTVLETARPKFPALTTLVLRKWNLHERSTERERLLSLVKLRARANLPIKALRFEFCSDLAEDKFLRDLRQIVDEVVVVEQDPKS
ncbi:hypothetical protein H0H92_001229, partial [Tricholoma furcatifolium]